MISYPLLCTRWSCISAERQELLLLLRRMVRTAMSLEAPTASISASPTFVASCVRVGAVPDSPNCEAFRVFGVNYEIHRRVTRGGTLKGILKGCAEQNAFGAVAAQGIPYCAIREVLMFGARGEEEGRIIGSNLVLPCPQCQAHMAAIALQVRRACGLVLPLIIGSSQTVPNAALSLKEWSAAQGVSVEVVTMPMDESPY